MTPGFSKGNDWAEVEDYGSFAPRAYRIGCQSI